MKKFRFIDHTGDLGIEVFGDSLSTLFQHAGEAFTEIITEGKKIRARESRHISLGAERIEDLLIRWLNEFIFLFDTNGFLPRSFDIAAIDDNHIEATAHGETYDKARHPIKTTVKGATYHQLRVVREDDLWKTRVIFDL
jgi:SHS2 domain-containing protein